MENGIIFVRERRKVNEKEKKPRFAVVAVAGVDLKVKSMHVRKQEIEEIASQLEAEVVYLKSGKDDCDN
jgi:phosphoenolpyruvate synthase/pyruvate phosphate dikinase